MSGQGKVPSGVPLEPTTVRFASDTMRLVRAASSQLGISVAQFVREAAVMRAMFLVNDEATDELRAAINEAYESALLKRHARKRD